MNLSPEALMVLIESVWAVSARRAFDKGYAVGVHALAGRPMQKRAQLEHEENVHNSALVLVRDEVAARLLHIQERVQALHDSASVVTGHGKSQRYVLQLVLKDLQAADAVNRSGAGALS